MSDVPPPPSQPNEPPGFASARVPEKVARGVTATGFLAFAGPHEVVIDFLQIFPRPTQIAARVILSPPVAEQFLGVLRDNLGHFTAQYGQPPALPKAPTPDRPRSLQEVYDDFKVADDLLAGAYATHVIVSHTPAEFTIDFIASFPPYAAVSTRVYMAAPRVPYLVDTVAGLLAQYKRQRTSPGPDTPPPPQGYGTAPGVPGFPPPPQE
jgi:hypothetical protein